MPIPIALAGAALQLIPMANRWTTSRRQKKASEQYAKTPRPDMDIPAAFMEYVDRKRAAAGTEGMPGGAQLEAKIARQGAGTNAAIYGSQQSPSSMLTGIIANDANSKEALGDLGIAGAQYKAGQEGALDNALQGLGEWENRKWEWEKKQPYLSAMATASSLRNAGMMNEQKVYEDLAGMAGNFLSAIPQNGGKELSFGDLNGEQPMGRIAPYGGGGIPQIPTSGAYQNADIMTPDNYLPPGSRPMGGNDSFQAWLMDFRQQHPDMNDEQIGLMLQNMMFR